MITKSLLLEVIQDQKASFSLQKTIEREMTIPLNPKRIIIISGIRRCGKSTILRQKLLISDTSIYINFEDPRLINFTLEDFTQLGQIADENGKTQFVLDEVQNVEGWELFARMANEKGLQLFITGSNASMLSRELGTRLTGRYNQIELFPFSYNEFLKYYNQEKNIGSFASYFQFGGFPEYLEEKDENYLRTLLRDIVTRDIAVRKNIVNENQLIRLAVHLFSNIGKEFSYNKTTKLLEFKSVRTVIDYCDFFRESYLMDFVSLYSTSIRKQIANPKKVYSIDPAFSQANSLTFSKDLGRRLENFVYLKLRRKYKEILYYKNVNSECDFLVKESGQVVLLVQSCWEVNNANNEREVKGIQNAMKETGCSNSVIITYNQEDRLDGIDLIPAWKWL